jgi:hypothetical protein
VSYSASVANFLQRCKFAKLFTALQICKIVFYSVAYFLWVALHILKTKVFYSTMKNALAMAHSSSFLGAPGQDNFFRETIRDT